MKPTVKVVQLLDDVLLTNGAFDYEIAMQRLLEMRNSGQIDIIQYLNLVDACNHRNETGHYRECLIYKRAAKDEGSSWLDKMREAQRRVFGSGNGRTD